MENVCVSGFFASWRSANKRASVAAFYLKRRVRINCKPERENRRDYLDFETFSETQERWAFSAVEKESTEN